MYWKHGLSNYSTWHQRSGRFTDTGGLCNWKSSLHKTLHIAAEPKAFTWKINLPFIEKWLAPHLIEGQCWLKHMGTPKTIVFTCGEALPESSEDGAKKYYELCDVAFQKWVKKRKKGIGTIDCWHWGWCQFLLLPIVPQLPCEKKKNLIVPLSDYICLQSCLF